MVSAGIRDRLDRFPAVVLVGPRQVGKTTLVRGMVDELAPGALYLDLERPSDRARLSDAEAFFAAHADRLVVLDEIHRVPELFPVLRGVIDERRRAGRRSAQFLMLGSASLDLLRQSSESLAGRLSTLELTPLLVEELPTASSEGIDRLWSRGGFPESFLAPGDHASHEWRLAFIQTYLERDIPLLGPRVPAETLRRFWTMLAHEQGQLLNAARLAAGLGVSGQTVARYVDLLVDLLLARRLPAWAGNVGKRLVRAPKVFLRDSGIVHSLLGLPDLASVLGHPVVGGSWEGLVIENLVAAMPAGAQVWFYRTSAGAEIDLLIELGGRIEWAFEIKRSSAPSASRGFRAGCEDLRPARRAIVYPGAHAFRLDPEIEALPLLEAVRRVRGSSDGEDHRPG
jgi:predicted AAA+ superfamily ATPase